MTYAFMSLFILVIVGLDQWSKYLVVHNIPLGGHMDFLPGIAHLTYLQNTGAAFSSFQGGRWMFVVIFAVFAVGVIWCVKKNILPFSPLEQWCLAAILGGGIGNLIDRIAMGYVVDMVATDFMDFAVFNVADSFITCGAIALAVHLVFFNKDFWKDEKKAKKQPEEVQSEENQAE